MKKMVTCWLAIAAGTALLTSCNRAQETPAAKSEAPAAVPATEGAKADSNASANEITIESVTCEQWDQALAAQKGKIVVVDTWATWCIPCREEFPRLVELHRQHAEQGVVCMSVSVDEPAAKEEALGFLREHQATFANYLIEDKPDAWWDKWNIKGIPIVLVFDRDGKLSKKFDMDDPDNQFTYEDVEKHVKEMLAAK